jgi:uncharacterized membrane protein YraQ (UPF0718 family)
VIEFLHSSAVYAWEMLVEAAPYIWLGFLAAGILHAFVPQQWIMSQLGGRGHGSVWKAALLGVPIPLCSCGVIPAAVGLRKRGAGRGATLSFLISTPETSADSIALTWALLGPVWAIVRPVAAVFVAVFTGTIANLLPDRSMPEPEVESCGCGCGSEQKATGDRKRVRHAWRFVFKELVPDIGGWLLLGIALSGILLALLPEQFLENLPGGAGVQMLVALIVGVPLYICAAASTPLAAALLLKGLAPGAALVLLLAGPATNLASALVVSRQLGKAGTAVYFGGVALGSLAAGAVVQALAPGWRLGDIRVHDDVLPLWLAVLSAVALLAAILVPWLMRKLRPKPPVDSGLQAEDQAPATHRARQP